MFLKALTSFSLVEVNIAEFYTGKEVWFFFFGPVVLIKCNIIFHLHRTVAGEIGIRGNYCLYD